MCSLTGGAVPAPAVPSNGKSASKRKPVLPVHPSSTGVPLPPPSDDAEACARTVFFARVPPEILVEEILAVFLRAGPVTGISLFRPWVTSNNSKGCGLVQYERAEDAEAAIQQLNGLEHWPTACGPLVVELMERHKLKAKRCHAGPDSDDPAAAAAHKGAGFKGACRKGTAAAFQSWERRAGNCRGRPWNGALPNGMFPPPQQQLEGGLSVGPLMPPTHLHPLACGPNTTTSWAQNGYVSSSSGSTPTDAYQAWPPACTLAVGSAQPQQQVYMQQQQQQQQQQQCTLPLHQQQQQQAVMMVPQPGQVPVPLSYGLQATGGQPLSGLLRQLHLDAPPMTAYQGQASSSAALEGQGYLYKGYAHGLMPVLPPQQPPPQQQPQRQGYVTPQGLFTPAYQQQQGAPMSAAGAYSQAPAPLGIPQQQQQQQQVPGVFVVPQGLTQHQLLSPQGLAQQPGLLSPPGLPHQQQPWMMGGAPVGGQQQQQQQQRLGGGILDVSEPPLLQQQMHGVVLGASEPPLLLLQQQQQQQQHIVGVQIGLSSGMPPQEVSYTSSMMPGSAAFPGLCLPGNLPMSTGVVAMPQTLPQSRAAHVQQQQQQQGGGMLLTHCQPAAGAARLTHPAWSPGAGWSDAPCVVPPVGAPYQQQLE